MRIASDGRRVKQPGDGETLAKGDGDFFVGVVLPADTDAEFNFGAGWLLLPLTNRSMPLMTLP
jgi:hypothetical protein